MIWAPAVASDSHIQISQLAVYDSSNANVALNKSCSASSTYSGTACGNALDGTLANRNMPAIFHSSNVAGDWFRVDLGADVTVTRVMYYNRLSFAIRAGGSYLQLLDANQVVIAQRTLTSNAIQTFTFSPTTESLSPAPNMCMHDFEGGSWLLVRRVRQGTIWHPSRDQLAGKDVYGTYGSANSDSTFSLPFASLVNSSTQFLFITSK